MGVNHTKEKADLMRRLWQACFDGMTKTETLELVEELCEEYQRMTEKEIEVFVENVRNR